MQIKIPCVVMRGGTSRGPFFLESDLPTDVATRDRVLVAAMGSPHVLQIDGLGGGHPLTSKVAIISKSSDPRADVDYLFAQVAVDRGFVDTAPNCGNMLAGVGPFAIEAGLTPTTGDETVVRILNRNTDALIEAVIQTPGGVVEYEGESVIDGVPGTAAPIKLNFLAATGSKTGALFPTGRRSEEIDGVLVSLVDYAMPMMLLAGHSVGIAGDESPETLDANFDLRARLERLRKEAGRRMGLGDVTGSVIPKIGVLSQTQTATIRSRYFVPDLCHKAHAVTGALCIAAAARLPGTVAADLASRSKGESVVIEHPSGSLEVAILVEAPDSSEPRIRQAAVIRTARRLFEGNLLLPSRVFDEPIPKAVAK